jgi:tetratricopeptide (TPR) repeat protein/4-amino-4-deoxy-L-arabinose transferase-like glycosyltransferase
VKPNKKEIKPQPKSKQAVVKPKRKIDWFPLVIIGLCFILYGNTIPNHYSMDDELVTNSNKRVSEGIKAIPGIWTTLYAEGKLKYEYRPVVKSVFAIEAQFFGTNPHVSHFVNILIYILTCLLLYYVLKKLLKNFHPLFAIIAVLLFIAHPVHTEVIASLKNRDEMLSFLGCLACLYYLIRYAETSKWIYMPVAFIIYLLAYFSKESAIVFLAIFPLTLYFFTNSSSKKLIIVIVVIFVALILARYTPKLYLPKPDREVFFFENPLSFHPGLIRRFGTGMMSLLFYLRILIFPHPLLFYYGYNTIPIVPITNGLALFSLLVHLGLFVFAVIKLKQKHIMSYIILFYLICISMFSNIVKPAMGIVGERYCYASSVAFCLALAYGIFILLKKNPRATSFLSKDTTVIIIVLLLILIPYSARTIVRNRNWDTHMTLYKHDITDLENSAKANALIAGRMNTELTDKLVKGLIPPDMNRKADSIIMLYNRCISIYPKYYSSYNNIGSVYFTIKKDFPAAIWNFKKALEIHPDYVEALYNMAYSFEMLGRVKRDSNLALEANSCFLSAVMNYKKAIALKPDYVKAMGNLANIYYYEFKNLDSAIAVNKQIIHVDPATDVPYVNLANYSLRRGDTAMAMSYMEKAVQLIPQNYQTYMRLSNYFRSKHDFIKADKYQQLAEQAKRRMQEMKNTKMVD